MKRIVIAISVFCLLAAVGFAAERTMLARVTVYWASGGSGSDHWTRKHKAATKVRLRSGQHCAVDPRRIPYGSKVILPDATLTAVDTGGHVKSRYAARRSGRTAAQRSAIVVDRFFETKAQALAWARRNPRFMKVRVVGPDAARTTTIAKTTTTTTAKVASVNRRAPGVKTSSAPKLVSAKPTFVTTRSETTSTATVAAAPVPGSRPALRNSISTPRTPAPVAAAPAPQPLMTAKPTPARPAISAAHVATATTGASTRLASNSPTELRPNPNIMIHDPSHHGRAVSYLP